MLWRWQRKLDPLDLDHRESPACCRDLSEEWGLSLPWLASHKAPLSTAETAHPQNMLQYLPKHQFFPFVAKLTLKRFLSTVYIGPQGLILLLQLCCTWLKEKVQVCGFPTVSAFLSCHKCTYVLFLYSSNLWSCRGFLYRSNKCLLMRQMAVCFLLVGTLAPREDT